MDTRSDVRLDGGTVRRGDARCQPGSGPASHSVDCGRVAHLAVAVAVTGWLMSLGGCGGGSGSQSTQPPIASDSIKRVQSASGTTPAGAQSFAIDWPARRSLKQLARFVLPPAHDERRSRLGKNDSDDPEGESDDQVSQTPHGDLPPVSGLGTVTLAINSGAATHRANVFVGLFNVGINLGK
jgi:hypothetical protein